MNDDWLAAPRALDDPQSDGLPDPAEWVAEYGDYLFRYAIFRERDRATAEDLVQDTFLSALRARETFRGHSSPRTWLISILKRKLIDQARDRARKQPFDAENADECGNLFNRRGKWRVFSLKWGSPEANLQREEFWKALEHCLSQLPPRMSAAFTMREMEDRTPEHIRAELEISPSNLNVILHRARLALSHCLDQDWFANCGKEG